MIFKFKFLALLGSFLSIPNLAFASYTQTFERIYTVSTVTYPDLCQDDEYAKSCAFMTNYYLNRFDHAYIGYLTKHLDLDSEDTDGLDLDNRELASQEINFDYRVIKEFDFLTVIADVRQSFKGKNAHITEVYNIELSSSKPIFFNNLFEDPTLAAQLCANYVEDYFAPYKKPNLPIFKAQIENDPRNFMILPDALEFVFTKGVLAPNNVKSRIIIPITYLAEAKPIAKWFPVLKAEFKNDKRLHALGDPLDGKDD